jgi:rod shape-determining protein MreC
LANRTGHFQDLKVPLTWTVGLALVVAAVIAIAILLSDRRETMQVQAYGAARAVTDMVDQPVGQVVAAPSRWGSQGLGFISDYLFAASENRRLHKEVQELKQWRDVSIALADTNARYKALLGFRTEPPIPMVAARVVLDARGPFSNARLADAGREAGVQVGNPVMSDRGLIGRVVGVTRGASRVLMLTDVASRTPVLIDRTDARAILSGDGGQAPKLDYLRGQEPVRQGDRVLTSGDGGMFPRGLPIGVAVKGLDGTWRVRLDANEASIDYVRILMFKDFSQLVDLKALATPQLPPTGPLTSTQTVTTTANAASAPPAPPAKAPPAKAAPAKAVPAAPTAAPAAAATPPPGPAVGSAAVAKPPPAAHAAAVPPRPASPPQPAEPRAQPRPARSADAPASIPPVPAQGAPADQ